MMRRRIYSALCAGLVLTVLPGLSASAAEAPLEIVPQSATAVVRLKSLDATIDKVAEFVNAVQPGMGGTVRNQAQGIGILISNQNLTGVDRTKDWWFTVFAEKEAEPGVVFVIPATDSAAMKQALGENIHTHEYKDWVAYSEDAGALAKIKEQIDGGENSIGDLIDEKAQAVLDRGELSVFVNISQLTTTYADEIEQLQLQLNELLQQFKELGAVPLGAAGGQAVDLAPMLEVYGGLLRGLMQGVQDMRGFSVAVGVTSRGMAIEEYAQVKPRSEAARYFADHPPSDLKQLELLPEGKLAYFGAHGDMGALMQLGTQMSLAMAKPDAEDAKEVEALADEIGKLEFKDLVGAFGFGDLKQGAVRVTMLSHIGQPAKMRELAEKTAKLMQAMQIEGYKQEVTYKRDAEEYGDYKADVMILKQEVSPEVDPLGIQEKVNEYVYGPDGMTNRLIYLDNMVVQTTGGGRADMEAALAAIKAQKLSPQVTAVREQLSPKVNAIALVDLPGIIAEAIRLTMETGEVPLQIDPQMFKTAGPSFMGFAFNTEADAVLIQTYIPVEQLQGIIKIAMGAQMMMLMQQQF
jgi:hypothetical protein